MIETFAQDMGMNFHSDNEPGLGDVVASLSMGAICKMQFRVREKLPKGTIVTNADELKKLGKGTILTLELRHVSSPGHPRACILIFTVA